MAERIPALVVSGFLGSGKTTLVRHLLADAQREGVRVAVISNEFGELGIDEALLGQTGEEYVELEGGCVCCRLSDELVETLERLWQRVRPDRVIIETSGVALPFDVQLNLWRDPVAAWVDDDVAVVVVNAEQLYTGRDLDGTFEQQVSAADLLLLNQLDRVPADAAPALEAALREIEPDAPIVHAVHAEVDPTLLFPPDPDGIRAERRRVQTVAPAHDHEVFEAESVAFPPGISRAAAEAELRARGGLRVKGFVQTDDGLALVQGVGDRIDWKPAEPAPPAALIGRVVVIRRVSGRNAHAVS